MSLNLSDRPFFIIGAPRSGTTLLQYMLRSHPALSLPTAESHFFIPFQARRAEFGDLSQKENLRALLGEIYDFKQSFFDSDVHGIDYDVERLTEILSKQGCDTLPAVISGIFRANAAAEGKSRWGDKTPYYILHLDTLNEMFPNAQFIHLIRDGRDCALSMLKRRWDLQIYNTYHAAYTWDRYVKAGRAFGSRHDDRKYFELRYEDILDRPEETIGALCAFLDVAYDESVINFRKSKGQGKTPLLKKPLKKDNRDKWRGAMSERALRIFESQAGETLRACGYTPALAEARLGRLGWALCESHLRLSQHYASFRRRLARVSG